MSRIETLKQKVMYLYEQKNPNRNDWADWLYEKHIFSVSEKSKELAKLYGANQELAEAAGMLHDIGDAVISRFDSAHEEETNRIARNLLSESGFHPDEITIIVDDALRYHSCHENLFPQTLEGKVMSTADAYHHLMSGYYDTCEQLLKSEKTKEEISRWAVPKIVRDFSSKIFFDDVKNEVQERYEHLKSYFEQMPRE